MCIFRKSKRKTLQNVYTIYRFDLKEIEKCGRISISK